MRNDSPVIGKLKTKAVRFLDIPEGDVRGERLLSHTKPDIVK
jgi:hypothetical protein